MGHLTISSPRFVAAVKVCGVHLLLSGSIALLAAIVVLLIWFPYPYRELAGGAFLFLVMVGVDVLCGPLLTLILYNPAKSRRELVLDFSLVALIQLGALLYGMHSISLARPVALVYEVDRFVVVTAAEVDPESLMQADPTYRRLPWVNGPWMLGVRAARDTDEAQQNLILSLQGNEPSARPGWWQPYESSRVSVQAGMRPVLQLLQAKSESAQLAIDAVVQKIGIPLDQLSYLPLVSQRSLDGWIVLLDKQASIVGYVPVNGWV